MLSYVKLSYRYINLHRLLLNLATLFKKCEAGLVFFIAVSLCSAKLNNNVCYLAQPFKLAKTVRN